MIRLLRLTVALALATACARGLADPDDSGRADRPAVADGSNPGGDDARDDVATLDAPAVDALGSDVLPDRVSTLDTPAPDVVSPSCTEGQMRACYSGPAATRGVGTCREGAQTCSGGRWSACVGEVAPASENCSTPADEDCDGVVNNGCGECVPGASRACYSGPTGTSGVGPCHGGTQTCSTARMWAACVGEVVPSAERCNGVDDDCNGTADNGATCATGETCISGACVRTEWLFEAEAPEMGHAVGRRDAEGWSASTGSDAPGTLVFGPYTRDIPAGLYDAHFRLLVDNRSADNLVVARVDVNDFDGMVPDCGSCVLAQLDVRRMDFTGTFAYQDFVLRFRNPGAMHRLEFRTWWADFAYIREDYVRIVRVGP